MFLRKGIALFKDILFPVFCVECGREGEWWCDDCLKKIDNGGIFKCPVCGGESSRGEVHHQCAGMSFLDGVAAFFDYSEGQPAAELIKQFKYNHAKDIEAVWEKILKNCGKIFFRSVISAPDSRFREDGRGRAPAGIQRRTAIIPVPLHPLRERERGFNQANILGEILLKNLNEQGKHFILNRLDLIRVRYTAQQAKLSKTERQKNTAGAFEWRGALPAPENIILVDDVFTSGATMQECAKALKSAGAKKVWGMALARGV